MDLWKKRHEMGDGEWLREALKRRIAEVEEGAEVMFTRWQRKSYEQ